ncbi:glycosyl hydrolase family 18 protein [Gottfriedia acidiceleris]|uniref:glycosyl hydrolase family 18 protein n=1 Tax=Gottfriedia acidiceleris TaxID=371036 RepID=UPI000B443E43|nr:glycosyl hydrolase family 18 protein [Gottfriedia acidiceleris]
MNKLASYFWINLFLVILLVVIVPTGIVMFFGKTETFHIGTSVASQFSNTIPQLSDPLNEINLSKTITLGWVTGNNVQVGKYTTYQGLNIVSPALLTINEQFNLNIKMMNKNLSTNNQIAIWPRIVINKDSNKNIHAFLSNEKKKKQIINAIRNSTIKNNWTGVNMDIENVGVQDRNNFSMFINQLSQALHSSNVLLSIDIPPDFKGSGNKNTPFDHQELGLDCDYVIFMGYDQHWSSDPTPGPTTSLNWLKNNLQEMIHTGLPPNKIILALPTYTRIWQLDKNGKVVKNPAYAYSYVERFIQQKHESKIWDPVLGEYTSTFSINDTQYKIWLPSIKSINIYLSLISEMQLGGSAFWNLNLISQKDWNQLF